MPNLRFHSSVVSQCRKRAEKVESLPSRYNSRHYETYQCVIILTVLLLRDIIIYTFVIKVALLNFSTTAVFSPPFRNELKVELSQSRVITK